MRFNLYAECRNPSEWQRNAADLYAETIEHMVAAEALGFHAVEFAEHHFSDDGYIPSPLIAATAVAARTKHIRVGTNIMLLPLYNPVRVAEDTAVLDIISNGRLDLGVGLGYRKLEYEGQGISFSKRGERIDEALEILLRLWTGELLSFEGKHFQVRNVRTTPRCVQKPHPRLWIGAFSRPGVKRAARYGDGFTGVPNKEFYELYRNELKALGKDPSSARVKGILPGAIVVSEDPDRTFHQLAKHTIYWANSYAKWLEGTGVDVYRAINNVDELRATGLLNVMTPDDAVRFFQELSKQFPMESVSIALAPPGVRLEAMTDYLELFASKVMPNL
jgi:alkanesulfonate monooxygenase SsuD/methylene tetrahydromethanopterin reductase-like flavin-dependent oxidoreductase (luciferase family)